MYLEHKTDQNDRGSAWIGLVEFSKSGRTLYFNGQAFKSNSGYAFAYSDNSNYYDVETHQGYWISGIKKDGQNRHWAGAGKIRIDRKIVDDYLAMVDFTDLDENKFERVDIRTTDKQKFARLENEKQE